MILEGRMGPDGGCGTPWSRARTPFIREVRGLQMPILPAEPDLHPMDLWQRGGHGTPDERWWCLHTKPRQEKALARALRSVDISFYLPLAVKVDRTPQGRTTRSIIPFFTGYLFLLGDELGRLEAIRSNRIANVLEVADQQSLIQDLSQVHRLLSSGLPVVAEPIMSVGARVRIITGPLKGIVGTVIRRGKRDQFIAAVHFLGRGATVDLADWQVERVAEDTPLSLLV